MWWWSHRAYFWGGALVVVGSMLLLGNLGFLDNVNWNYVWPAALIAAGVWILLVRVHPRGAPTYAGHAPVERSDPKLDLTKAKVQIAVEWARLDIRGAALGEQLYLARLEHSHTPPDVVLDRTTGTVRISPPDKKLAVGLGRVGFDLQLNDAVSWEVHIDSGSVRGAVDLSGVTVTGFECHSASSKIDLKLSKPTGEVPINAEGGSVQVQLHLPPEAEARVSAKGGSVRLTVDGARQGGGLADQTWQTPGFDAATDRFDASFSGGSVKIELERG
jgi:hypothetical protein